MREGRAILSCAGRQPCFSRSLRQPIFTSITPALSFNARSIHYDAHHIVGNKGARSGSARSNVTIVVNCSVSLHSPLRSPHRNCQNASIHAVKHCGDVRRARKPTPGRGQLYRESCWPTTSTASQSHLSPGFSCADHTSRLPSGRLKKALKEAPWHTRQKNWWQVFCSWFVPH